MAEKYPSKYSNGKSVSAAQYITEVICENKAQLSKEDLHYRFWLSKKWSLYYRNQIASANKLLEKYSPEAIVKALKSDKAKKIYSLRAPHLLPIIQQQEDLLASQNQTMSKIPDRKLDKTFESSESKQKNILSKLRELDNDC
jgi:hypothetical protein